MKNHSSVAIVAVAKTARYLAVAAATLGVLDKVQDSTWIAMHLGFDPGKKECASEMPRSEASYPVAARRATFPIPRVPFVRSMEAFPSVSVPARARIASMVSGMTIA